MTRRSSGQPLARPAEQRDLEQIAAIYAHYVERSAVTFDLSAPSLEQWREKCHVAHESGHPWLVGELEGEIYGYFTSCPFNPRAAYRSTVETSIYLAADSVGQGLGRFLFEAALRELSSATFHLAVAAITLPNRRSVNLHEALGFKRVGALHEVGYKLGSWHDVAWWQRELPAPR